MMTKIKIIIICGVLILSVFVGLFIRISLRKQQSKSEQTLAPMQLSVESPKSSTSSEKPSILLKELNVPVLPIPKPDLKAISGEKTLPSTVVPFFENINEAAKTVEESLIPNNAPIQKTSNITSTGIILSLTENQFHFLYPNNFIADLMDAQNLFIKEFNPSYEPLLKIETDTQVRFVEEKIVTNLLSANMLTKERAEQLITTIRFTLPQLQRVSLEKQYSYESLPFSKFINTALGGGMESPRTAPKGLFLAGFTEQLVNALANKAYAVCGSCSSRPLCFQDNPDTPGKLGSTLFYPSCYCTGCLSSLGCLSANEGDAAIYDQETGICGIGSGAGGGGGF